MMKKEMIGAAVLLAALGTSAAVGDAASPGNVRLKGYLGDRLEQMLANHVMATDVDYITAPFLEKSERHGWWQTEFWGKWMHSAVPFQTYTGSAKLKASLDRGIATMLSSQEPSGYIGNYPDELRCGEGWDVWGMKYTMLGLLHYYDATEDAKTLEAAKRVCDYVIGEIGPGGRRGRELWQTGNWSGFASSSILEPVVWLYNRTKDRKYLDFATFLVKGMTEPATGPRLVDLALEGHSVADRNGFGNVPEKHGGYVMKHNRWKAYEMMSCYQGLIEYYLVTGRKDLLDAAVATAGQIIRDEINVAGGCASSEAWYHGAKKQHLPYTRLQETCVTTTWMRFCEKLLEVTGDPKYADELEKSFYNIYLASLNRSADEFAAYTPMNGSRYRGHHHCYMHTNCCNANGPRGFLAFLRAMFAAKDDVATMNFYASGKDEATLPKSGRKVTFESYSLYPRANSARLVNHTPGKEDFTLALRIPAWSAKTVVKVNGQSVGDVKPGAYLNLKRTWQIGDVVEIAFDMAVVKHRLDHYVAFTRGPIALARDSRFNDGPIDEVFRAHWVRGAETPAMEPSRDATEEFWMTFTASLPVGSHHEHPEGAVRSTVHFCDYASAGNLWEPSNAYRVWFPVEYGPAE